MESWNEKLNTLISAVIANCQAEESIDFDKLVRSALLGESEQSRNALAEKQVRREIGIKLRRWALEVDQPMIPDLLDGFVEKDGNYVHTSNLSREEWMVRKYKLQRRIITLEERVTAIDEVLSQIDLPKEGT